MLSVYFFCYEAYAFGVFQESYAWRFAFALTKPHADMVKYLFVLRAQNNSAMYFLARFLRRRLSDRMVQITTDSIERDQKTVERCMEKALGLRGRFGYTIDEIHSSIAADIYESIDPEDEWPSSDPVSKKTLLAQTSHQVFDEIATYFEFIRNSLRKRARLRQEYADIWFEQAVTSKCVVPCECGTLDLLVVLKKH